MAAQQSEISYFKSTMMIGGGYHGINAWKRGAHFIIYVGIDIAKLNHCNSTISSNGEELIKPFKFTSDANDFQLLPLIWIPFRMTASSSVLSQRPSTATALFVISFIMVIRSVLLIRSRPRPSGRTTSGRPRQIRLTPISLLKLLCWSSLIGSYGRWYQPDRPQGTRTLSPEVSQTAHHAEKPA